MISSGDRDAPESGELLMLLALVGRMGLQQ